MDKTDMLDGDLKRINGIGPSMETKLKDLGIADVSALALQTDPGTIAELLKTRGVDAERVGKWIEDAKAGPIEVPNPEPVVGVVSPASETPAPAELVGTAPAEPIVTAPEPHATDATPIITPRPMNWISLDADVKHDPNREPTLHELNMQQRAIGQRMNAERAAARIAGEAAANAVLKTARFNRPRRLQKPLRAPIVQD